MHTGSGAGRPSTACRPYNSGPRGNLGLAEPPPPQQSTSSQIGVDSPLENRHLNSVPGIDESARADIQFGVPSQLVSDLIDTFFTHAYNADLLLHRETFLQDQADGRVRPHVLLSVCAFAAIFHRDSNGHNSLKQHGFASEWAECAARLVLKEVEKPNEDNVISFLILALFWYSQGNWRRSYIHKGLPSIRLGAGSAVHNLIKSPDADSEIRLNAIYHLNTEITRWWIDLPENLRLDISNLSQTRRKDLPRLVLIHAVYYQCLCVMHSSLVPLYSWGKEEHVPLLAMQLSAQIAYDNACAVSELFQAILEQYSEFNEFTSFVGYAAYCGCAIQIPFMGCSDLTVKERATKNVRVNLQIIRSIGLNWKFVSLLYSYAEYIMEIHTNHPLHLTSEPKSLPPNKLNGFRITASKARASILEHNAVLWKEDGVSAQGDEVTDLGFGNEPLEARTQSTPVNDFRTAEGPALDANRTTHSNLAGISRSNCQPISRLSEISPQEFFQPLLDASDLFEVLPEYDRSLVGQFDITEW
ncbi:uncharacterized protein FTJAE_13605 [Fusarium tjaetaba]|uniref:Transcription factor domain-containing protein n=1 Tax=Fusarium tjaetaba TaxID=1567544 RepID=A0A8H5QE40_9HYPO|nr:uncharacterized protein FTJAE_13605 [Fusarium tjaetaba]KAF5614770.1 hypothetical protein FTJAE_13605 [Fusarium tjaetaba]